MAVALVTGGTSGIGAAFATELARRGFDLVLVARDEHRLESEAARHRASGRRVETISADLAVRADVERVAARLSDRSNPVEVLVNNAGFSIGGRLLDEDVSGQDRAFEVMVRAVLVLSGAAGRGMRDRGSGTIINVGSVAGSITMGAYSAVKAWVTSYSEGLSNELHGTGVRVLVVLPGWVRTEFHARGDVRTSSIPGALWLDPDTLVTGVFRDLARNRVVSIPTFRYKVLMFLLRHGPKSGIRAVSRVISSSRRSNLDT